MSKISPVLAKQYARLEAWTRKGIAWFTRMEKGGGLKGKKGERDVLIESLKFMTTPLAQKKVAEAAAKSFKEAMEGITLIIKQEGGKATIEVATRKKKVK